MKPDDHLKPKPTDPAEIEKLIELEMMRTRATWQQSKARRGNLRALSLLFLCLIVAAAIGIYFYFASLREAARAEADNARPSPSPIATQP